MNYLANDKDLPITQVMIDKLDNRLNELEHLVVSITNIRNIIG